MTASRKNIYSSASSVAPRNSQASKLKKAIDELRDRREPIHASHFSATIQNQLQNNPSVTFLPSENSFIYTPKYEASDKEGLLDVLCRSWPAPCLQVDLEDCYKNAARDLAELRKEYSNVIWVVRHSVHRVDQWYCSLNALRHDIYPIVDDGYRHLSEEEKRDFSEMWEEMGKYMPRTEDIETQLENLGIKPMKAVTFQLEEYYKQRRIEEYKESRGIKKRKRKLKVTNVHMLQNEGEMEAT